MANPLQEPKIALPGAEYFALAPNRDIIVENRLMQITSSGPISVPASAVGATQVSFIIDPNWGTSHGFYLVRGYGLYIPGDTTGELQITSARLGIGQPPTNIFLDLGIPTATLTTPPNAQLAIYDRDALITNFDTGPNWPQNTPLSLISQVSVKNLDATNPHNFQLTLQAVWHRATGFVQ